MNELPGAGTSTDAVKTNKEAMDHTCNGSVSCRRGCAVFVQVEGATTRLISHYESGLSDYVNKYISNLIFIC